MDVFGSKLLDGITNSRISVQIDDEPTGISGHYKGVITFEDQVRPMVIDFFHLVFEACSGLFIEWMEVLVGSGIPDVIEHAVLSSDLQQLILKTIVDIEKNTGFEIKRRYAYARVEQIDKNVTVRSFDYLLKELHHEKMVEIDWKTDTIKPTSLGRHQFLPARTKITVSDG